jgi:DNA-binding NarL/FixJ family response regulator
MARKLLTDNEHKTVVLVSQPGITHNVLLSLLRSVPRTTIIDAGGALTAYGTIENEQVDTVIIDTNMPLAERLALIMWIKDVFPRIQCIALTTTNRNHDVLQASGADQVFLLDASLQEMERVVFTVRQ